MEAVTALPGLTDADLAFVVAQAAPGSSNPSRLADLVREDPEFRKALVGDEKVLERVLSDEEVFLKVGPTLYFEVLLRGSYRELETAAYTVERSGRSSIPVFDTSEVTELLLRDGVIEYLAHMLASFTRINSYVVPVRVRPGVRRRIRYNDMDVDSLIALCEQAGDHERFAFYKRIADVCLFTSGVFPGYGRLPPGAQRRSSGRMRTRRTIEDYETEGRRFYRLAEEHPAARLMELTGVFALLRENFTSARKPLAFIASRYLHSKRHHLFGPSES